MKEKKIGVSKVVIQLGDKEVSLTLEQVKELSAALSALLGSERIIERWYPRYWYMDGGTITTSVYGNTTVGVTTNTDESCYILKLNDDAESADG